VALVPADWFPGFEVLVVVGTKLAVLVTVVLEELTVLKGKVAFVTREPTGPPFVVLEIDTVEVAV